MRRLLHGGLMGLAVVLVSLSSATVNANGLPVTGVSETGRPTGEPSEASAWPRLAAWGLPAGAVSLILVLLIRANRRQASLVRALRASETAAQVAAAKELAHTEHERFGKGLALALQDQDALVGFGTTLLELLCRRLDATAGAFHCRETGADAYVLAASYAGGASPAYLDRYRPGEGIAGQAVLDRRRSVCEGAAADWMWVESGTQVSTPLTVIVVPVVSGDRVPGVVELALMRTADADSLDLLDEVLPVVALSLDLLLSRLQTLTEFSRYRAMEEVQRRILDRVTDGIFGQDFEGRVIFANAAAVRMLGFSEEELLGRPMHAITHHHYADGRVFPREECPVYQCVRDGRTRTVVDQVFWCKDGTPLAVEYTTAAVMQDGAHNSAVISFRDITERLESHQELARRTGADHL